MKTKVIFFFSILVVWMFGCVGIASAEDYQSDYEAVSYDVASGLTSLEMNAVAQTDDGYIWVGSYSGLYRYDGVNFEKMALDVQIRNVMVLYTDSKKRLWIGTNDNGVFCYNPENAEISTFSVDDGFSSNAIRSISEDVEGNIYVGTGGFLSAITPEGRVITYSSLTDITYVRKLTNSNSDVVAGVTNSGTAFFMKGDQITAFADMSGKNGVYFTSCCAKEDGSFLLGDSIGALYQCTLSEGKLEPNVKDVCRDTGVGSISNIVQGRNGEYLICADNGLGILDNSGSFTDLRTENFNASVCNALHDQQGNFWFVSNKQGVMKLSKTPFIDIFKKAGIDNHIVNAVTEYGNDLYIGCVDGLIVLDSRTYKKKNYPFLSILKDVRIRHLFQDSQNNLWISTYGKDGLLCLDSRHNITFYNEENAGTMGGRFRFVVELNDNTILAASSTGLTYIKDGIVTAVIGEKEGLVMPQILTVQEREDGSVLAGSDGDGIYVIQDQQVVGRIGEKEGLESLVVLRIVKCGSGYIYVTSNSIYYDQDGQLTKLDQFPYSNNYDVYVSDAGDVWISSSAGLYIIDIKDFLENKSYQYTLLNQNRGFDTTLTANAWNYVDQENYYYLCCSTGVKKVSIPDYNNYGHDYNLLINYILIDNAAQLEAVDGKYRIPAGANRIVISPAVLNFTLENPAVHMYLEGFDDAGVTVFQRDLTEMNYTNLPHGEYKFHIQIIDDRTGEVENETVFPILKEAQFFEYTFFHAYLVIVICFVAIFITWLLSRYRSVTLIKCQYEEIRLAKEEAEQANHAKSQFLANVSHEIRTPINTIMGMNELVLREEITPEVRRHSEDIQNASMSLLSVVNDILDFSKIESGKMHIVLQEYDMARLLTELSTMLHVRAQQKNLTPEVVIDERIPDKFLGDAKRIRQIILNLLSNSVKYTEKGSITFSVELDHISGSKAYLNISVKDTGIGIHKEDMDKIFQTFERLDEKRNANIQGSGLGLNITKELLALMGSELRIDSVYGKGSKFYFMLEQEIVGDGKIGDIEEKRKKGIPAEDYKPQFLAPDVCILVVDDNEMNLKVVQGLLAATKVRVETGSNGQECLDKIHQKHYDMILLDHMMPKMDGIETLKHIKEEEHLCRDTPVIILTANAIHGVKEEYLEQGFTDYLSKPVTGDALETALAMYLPREKMLPGDGAMPKIPHQASAQEEVAEGEHVKQNKETEELPSESLISEEDGLMYSGGMMDLYQQMRQLFQMQSEGKIQEMDCFVQDEDWQNYRICIHALKSSAKGIGAISLSKAAAELEQAVKQEDVAYIKEHHPEAMELYQAVVQEIVG